MLRGGGVLKANVMVVVFLGSKCRFKANNAGFSRFAEGVF